MYPLIVFLFSHGKRFHDRFFLTSMTVYTVYIGRAGYYHALLSRLLLLCSWGFVFASARWRPMRRFGEFDLWQCWIINVSMIGSHPFGSYCRPISAKPSWTKIAIVDVKRSECHLAVRPVNLCGAERAKFWGSGSHETVCKCRRLEQKRGIPVSHVSKYIQASGTSGK